ncbi:MAG TPA: tetratricopeptide repeat protein [Elusimicrobiota bacterium]|nr:tetratricopeptide repeat protein [Elusimicrobiota bacterium]
MISSLTLALALAFPRPAAAAATAAPAAAARALYDAGNYADAAAAYEKLAAAAPRSAALQYDLGAAEFKAGRLGRATASFERAFALNPRDSDIRFNLAYTLRRAGEDFVPPGTPPALFWIFTALSERELAGLHWLAAWTTLLLAGAGLLAGAQRRRSLAPWTAAAAGAWVVFGLWWAGLRAALPPDRGVVVAPAAELRHGPGPNFGVAFTVPEGRRVRVLGASGPWLEVGVLKEGARGWIQADAIERL